MVFEPQRGESVALRDLRGHGHPRAFVTAGEAGGLRAQPQKMRGRKQRQQQSRPLPSRTARQARRGPMLGFRGQWPHRVGIGMMSKAFRDYSQTMKLERNWFGIRCEEFWFNAPGYAASPAPVVALRALEPPARYDCRVPEATWMVPLSGHADDWIARFSPRTRASIRHAERHCVLTQAINAGERRVFFDAQRDFARGTGLSIPGPDEQQVLEVFLARDATGKLLHGCAFLPFPQAGLYRYRYSVAVAKSQANAALLFAAMRRAQVLGCGRFDLGGYVPGARAGSKDAAINFFKEQFGGELVSVHFCLRASPPFLRLGLRALNPVVSRRGAYRALESLATFLARRLQSAENKSPADTAGLL